MWAWLGENWLAVVAVVLAVIALRPAYKALGRADTANSEARKANDRAQRALTKADRSIVLAEEANVLSTRATETSEKQLAMAQERHDVGWDWDWDQPGVVALRNSGTISTALDVRIRFSIDEETVTADRQSVGPGEVVALEFSAARTALEQEVEHIRGIRRPPPRRESIDRFVELPDYSSRWQRGMDESAYRLQSSRHWMQMRVDWATELGTPRTEGGSGFTSLGEHDAFL